MLFICISYNFSPSEGYVCCAGCVFIAVQGPLLDGACLLRRYLMGRITGLWFAFFAVQGPLLWAEGVLRRWGRARGWSVPRAVAIPLTLGTLLTIGHVLFFPPCTETGLADRVVDNIRDTYAGMLGAWHEHTHRLFANKA